MPVDIHVIIMSAFQAIVNRLDSDSCVENYRIVVLESRSDSDGNKIYAITAKEFNPHGL